MIELDQGKATGSRAAEIVTPAPRSKRPANADMVEGFSDGYDLTAPEPSVNRSASYRHGFMVGRLDNTPAAWGKYGTGELERLADEAMDADATQQTPGA